MSIFGAWPVFEDGVTFEDAQQVLTDAGLSDGLPLVPPTQMRLTNMLGGVAQDPAQPLGLMPPLFQELTIARVAYNCVLAGCIPGAVPLVLTASMASLEPSFNLLGLATTTGTTAVATVVHGPVSKHLHMNAGVNCLAPGNRANATLGRAIALVMRNLAGMATGAADMATMGQPGKYGMCFAEADDAAFAGFHVRRGLTTGDSAVTVLGVSGTAEVLPAMDDENWDSPEVVLEPVAVMMRATLLAGGGARKSDRPEHILLLPPELAGLIAKRGWTIDAVQNYVLEQAGTADIGPIAQSANDIHVIVTGGPGTKMTVLPLWAGGTRTITRPLEDLG